MHQYQDSTFNGLEFGIRFAERFRVDGVGGGGARPATTPRPTPTTNNASESETAAERHRKEARIERAEQRRDDREAGDRPTPSTNDAAEGAAATRRHRREVNEDHAQHRGGNITRHVQADNDAAEGAAATRRDRHEAREDHAQHRDGNITRHVQTDEAQERGNIRGRVQRAVRDGSISDQERTLFERGANAEVLEAERSRLETAIENAGGAAPQSIEELATYQERLQDLRESDTTLDERDQLIEAASTSNGRADEQALRDERAALEQEVVAVVNDRTALIGTLEAERASIISELPSEAVGADGQFDDYQTLRNRAQTHIETFIENDGQFYGGNDLVGDDWDNVGSDTDPAEFFDSLVNTLGDDEGMREAFALNQGVNDEDGGDSHADMQDHIRELRENDDSETANQVEARYNAARALTDIMADYEQADSSIEGASGRLEELDTEISTLEELNTTDREVLSPVTLRRLDQRERNWSERADASNERFDELAETPASDHPSPVGAEHAAEVERDSGGAGNGSNGGTDGPGTSGGGTGSADAAGDRTIDYTTDARREQVLTQAVQHGYVPQYTSFNGEGQAVYTVQPGDSYWSVTEQSSGGGFNRELFTTMMNTNAQRLGRQSSPELIHPNETLVIPGRNVNALVELLDLPTTRPAPQPDNEDAGSHGPYGADRRH